MNKEKKYKFAAILFAITTIVFAILYFTSSPTISDVYEDVGENFDECEEQIIDWEEEYMDQPESEEKQAALDAILNNCVDELSDSDEQLQ